MKRQSFSSTPFGIKNSNTYFKFEKYSITVLIARCKRRKTKFKRSNYITFVNSLHSRLRWRLKLVHSWIAKIIIIPRRLHLSCTVLLIVRDSKISSREEINAEIDATVLWRDRSGRRSAAGRDRKFADYIGAPSQITALYALQWEAARPATITPIS